MSPCTRRRILQLNSVVLGGSLAGCTRSRDEPSSSTTEIRLNVLQAVNRDQQPYTIHVLLVENGEPVYWKSAEVSPYNPAENRLGGGQFEAYPTDPGEYVLYAWRDDQPRDEWRQSDLRDHDAPCANIVIMIGDADTGTVKILRSFGCPE